VGGSWSSVSMIPANRVDAGGKEAETFSGSVLLRGKTARKSESTSKCETERQSKTHMKYKERRIGRLSRNVGEELPLHPALISQNSAFPIYFAVEV